MKNKALMTAATIGAVGIFALTGGMIVVAAASTAVETQLRAGAGYAYTCASVHFGMDDATQKGDIDLSPSTVSVGTHQGSIGTVSGIGMVSYTVSGASVYTDGSSGLKMSTSKANSTLAITFDAEILCCDIYAVGWNKDSAKLSVNGGSAVSVKSHSDVAGTGTLTAHAYDAYHFDFAKASTLTITATKRVIIGDIALRVGA